MFIFVLPFFLHFLSRVNGQTSSETSCKGKIEVVICIDMSGSFSIADYDKQTDFAIQFVNSFSDNGNNFDGEKGLKIGVVGFSSSFVRFTNNKMLSSDKTTILNAIKGNRQSGGTTTSLCFEQAGIAFDLRSANEPMGSSNPWGSFTNNQGARVGVPKIILLMTDGVPNNAQVSKQMSQKAIAQGITILGVGVGVPGATGDAQIKEMVSDPKDDHYVSVNQADLLNSKLAEIVKAVCIVDCEGVWGPWSTCNKQTGKQERTFVVTTAGDAEGDACPTTEVQDCPVSCESTWGTWSPLTCAAPSIATQQTRSIVVTITSKNGGAACAADEYRPCDPCQYAWGAWSACQQTTGMQTRSPLITSQPTSYAGQVVGTACPGPENQPCAVDCKGAYGPWSDCTSPSGNYPPFSRTRQHVTISAAMNGGNSCPGPETESCVPAVCYSGDSSANSFGSKIDKMRPITRYPTGHPALTRTSCGGALVAGSLIPSGDCSKQDVGGYESWYALDSGKSDSTLAQDSMSKLFFLQDDVGRLAFGMLSGGRANGGSYAKYSMDFTNWNINSAPAGTPLVSWAVQNDPATSSKNCKATGGKDCYEWDEKKMKSTVEWSWSGAKSETSGGVFGPLPAAGYCLDIEAGDTSGIDDYEFATEGTSGAVESKPFDGEALDFSLSVCTYFCHEMEDKGNPPVVVPQPPATGGSGSGSGSSSGSSSGSGSGSGSGGSGSTTAGSGGIGGTGSSGGDSGGGGTGGGGTTTTSDGSSGSSPGGGQGGGTEGDAEGEGAGGDDGGSSISGGDDGDSVAGSDGDGEANTSSADEDLSATKNNAGVGDDERVSSGSQVGAIVGGVIGALVVAALVVLLVKRRKKSQRTFMKDENSKLPKGWTMFEDPSTGYPCYTSPAGETQWDHPVSLEMEDVENPMKYNVEENGENDSLPVHNRTGTRLPEGWDKDTDDEGNSYYYGADGETSWVPPPGSVGGSAGGGDEGGLLNPEHTRSETILPEEWGKDLDADGNKYYFKKEDGTTSWEAPPGSVGGSASS
jgi:hypothetical protein